VHVPFCAHRCGYCDFVTVTGRAPLHGPYVDALLGELSRARAAGVVDDAPETVFVGGGTPTLLEPALLARLLDGLPRPTAELTVECNPETVTPELAALLAERGARVSLGAQSFQPELLATLERRARPDTVRRSVATLRAAGVRNLSLDLIYGVPSGTAALLRRDLDELVALGPEHVSAYELEAKPGTRFTVHHGAELRRQAELLEDHYEQVVARLEAAGYRWYETASFARDGHEGRHNRGYWTGRDYLGVGVGAVSTLGLVRRTNGPRLAGYLDAHERDAPPPHRDEALTGTVRLQERVMLGLRLAEGVDRATVQPVLDPRAVEQMAAIGLLDEHVGRLVLTRRGRLVANDVVARLIRDED
jgi:oxygen-independent coproporphyrinogen-3 oxidase